MDGFRIGDTECVNVSDAAFPKYVNKFIGTPLTLATHVLAAYLDRDELIIPPAVIIGYSSRLPTLLSERGFVKTSGYPSPWRSLWLDPSGASSVGVVEGFGVGAPGAVLVLEELVALGTRRFINLGIAGALPDDVAFGDIILCTGALRDEGVSHHYAPGYRYALPSSDLTNEIRRVLAQRSVNYREGTTWTIDALFRETREEALAYRDEGIVTVDMEAAALFVVGDVLGVEVSSLFSVSDHLLASNSWQLGEPAIVATGLATLLDVALDTLRRGANDFSEE
jgi:purine-nucleoside phosphorylase